MAHHDLSLLAAFIEHRLDEHERTRVFAHLAECADCRRVVGEMGRAAAPVPLPTRGSPRALHTILRGTPVRVWLPIAASVVLCTFAWLRFSDLPWESESDAPSVSDSGAIDEELLAKRSGVHHVAGKTFRVSDGRWIDASFDPAASMPSIDVRGTEQRAALLARVPALAQYAELGDRVVVVWDGTVYRFSP